MISASCLYCHKPFTSKNKTQKYCSRECYAKAIDKKVVLKCIYCGKERLVTPFNFNRSKKICKDCFPEYCKTISKTRKKAARKRAAIGLKTCIICGNEFEFRLNCKKDREKKICSKACTAEHNKKRLALLTPEQRAKAIKTRSEGAAWKAYVVSRVGSKHPNYKGEKRYRHEDYQLKKWRKDVFMRDYYTCQRCHKKGGILQAHHILPWSTNPEKRYDIDNGITLCYDCHSEVHGKKKRPMTYHCEICGIKKSDGRAKRCSSCAAKNRKYEMQETH